MSLEAIEAKARSNERDPRGFGICTERAAGTGVCSAILCTGKRLGGWEDENWGAARRVQICRPWRPLAQIQPIRIAYPMSSIRTTLDPSLIKESIQNDCERAQCQNMKYRRCVGG